MFLRKIAALAALTVAAAVLSLTGCGHSQPVTYAPTAYGIPGHCYYADDPGEAIALRAAGLCPPSWAPTLMPLAWHQRYYSYYDSPTYYNRYVPVRVRTVYVQRQASFGTTYKTAIVTQSKTATYKSSSGKTVTGTKVGTAHFGSGTSFGSAGQKYGGGGLRPHAPAPHAPAVHVGSGGHGGR